MSNLEFPEIDLNDTKCYPFNYTSIDYEKGKVAYTTYEMNMYLNDINLEIENFLKSLSEDFWIGINDARYSLANWIDGNEAVAMVHCDGKNFLITDDFEERVRWKTKDALFNIEPDQLSFTEIVMLYKDLNMLDDNFKTANVTIFDILKAIIYEYISCASWNTRRKVLKVLEDEIFNLSYKKLRKSLDYVKSRDWKIGVKYV